MSEPKPDIRPNRAQFRAYVESDLDGEVVMLNLLRFDEREAEPSTSGRLSYARYGEAVGTLIAEQGGRVVWAGEPRHVFIGDPDSDQWDAVVLVSYPSRQAFLDMVSSPRYNEIHGDREGGLAQTVVLACTPAPGSSSGAPQPVASGPERTND